MMKKVSTLGLLLLSLAACDTTTSALNTVGSGVSAAGNAVSSTVATGAAALTPTVSAPVMTTTAPVEAAPVAVARTGKATTKSTGKTTKKTSHKTHHSRVDRNPADGAYMGGGMVVTTPVTTGTVGSMPAGTVVPGATVR
jgi:hypothetical protein